MVGRGLGGLYAQMFTATYDEQVVGLVLVNAVSDDFYDRVRPLLPADALDEFEQDLAMTQSCGSSTKLGSGRGH